MFCVILEAKNFGSLAYWCPENIAGMQNLRQEIPTNKSSQTHIS